MICLWDFLIWYNNLDVVLFVSEVLRLEEFYFGWNIDIFKIVMLVLGIVCNLVWVDVLEFCFCCLERKIKIYFIL